MREHDKDVSKPVSLYIRDLEQDMKKQKNMHANTQLSLKSSTQITTMLVQKTKHSA